MIRLTLGQALEVECLDAYQRGIVLCAMVGDEGFSRGSEATMIQPWSEVPEGYRELANVSTLLGYRKRVDIDGLILLFNEEV